MKKYIRSSEDSDNYSYGFNYRMLKPLIAESADDYFDYLKDNDEEPEYDSAIDFITDKVQEYLESFDYSSIEKTTIQYLDNNYNFKK